MRRENPGSADYQLCRDGYLEVAGLVSRGTCPSCAEPLNYRKFCPECDRPPSTTPKEIVPPPRAVVDSDSKHTEPRIPAPCRTDTLKW